jgi:hypothetical protein
MRTVVRICFNVDDISGGAQAVLGPAQCGPDVATVDEVPVLGRRDAWVTLEDADPRGPLVFKILKQHGQKWWEWHEDRYTEEELDSARLLLMHENRQCEIDGGVKWGATYDLSGACPACGTGGRQTSAMFVEGGDLANLEGHRAAVTYFGHVLVDDRLAADLEDSGATGLSFHSVYAVMPDQRQVKLRWKQLSAASTLQPMSPRTTGLARERACEVCWRNGYCLTSEEPTRIVYRTENLRDANDVNASWENEWFANLKPVLRESLLSWPFMLVTPKVRRIFCAAGATVFDWLPIRVEEMEGATTPTTPRR